MAFPLIQAAIMAAGIGISLIGGSKARKAQEEAASASRDAERLRLQQLELESLRRQRSIIRQAQAARAQAIASAQGRGALSSDVLSGALGQIQSQAGQQLVSQNENTAIARGIFDANATASFARSRAERGQAISDFGKTLFSAAGSLGRIGATAGGESGTIEGESSVSGSGQVIPAFETRYAIG